MAEFVENESLNNAHHGPPILTDRDMHILQAMTNWIQIVREQYGKKYNNNSYKDWLPSEVDLRKSRLFWRLRSGKEALPAPPPTCWSCPWYEVVEEERAHWLHDDVYPDKFDKQFISIAQCRYVVYERENDFPSVVGFGPYRFKLWFGENKVTSITSLGREEEMIKGYWMQIIKNG